MTMQNSKIEKRSVRRHKCFLRVGCAVPGKSYGETLCCDISTLGIGLRHHESIPVDTNLRVSLITKHNAQINLDGVVRWCEKEGYFYRVGVKFDKRALIPLHLLS
jgi:hypothetical protein